MSHEQDRKSNSPHLRIPQGVAARRAASGRDLNQRFGCAQAQKSDTLGGWRDGRHGLKREFHTRCVSKTHCEFPDALVLSLCAISFLGHAENKQTLCQDI